MLRFNEFLAPIKPISLQRSVEIKAKAGLAPENLNKLPDAHHNACVHRLVVIIEGHDIFGRFGDES